MGRCAIPRAGMTSPPEELCTFTATVDDFAWLTSTRKEMTSRIIKVCQRLRYAFWYDSVGFGNWLSEMKLAGPVFRPAPNRTALQRYHAAGILIDRLFPTNPSSANCASPPFGAVRIAIRFWGTGPPVLKPENLELS